MRFLTQIILAAILPSSGVQEIPPYALTNDVVSISEAAKMRHNATYGQRFFFRLEGRISATLGKTFILRDNSDAANVIVSCDDKWSPGDTARLVATHLRKEPFDPLFTIEALSIEVLAHGVPDAVRPVSPARLTDELAFCPVIVNGVVTDAFRDEVSPDWNILMIEADGTHAAAFFEDRNATQVGLNKMIGSVVSVEGVFFPKQSGSRRYLGAWIHSFSKDSVHIVEPTTADSFSVEEMRDDRILADAQNPRRRKASGTVVATWGERSLFLRISDTRTVEVQLERGSPKPPVGSCVTVSGFVRQNTFYARLCNALLRIDSVDGGDAGVPVDVSARNILFDEHGERKVVSRLNGHLIRISGSVRDILVSWKDERRIILNCDGITVPVILAREMEPPEIGSEVSVSGACLIATESDGGEFVRLGGFSVVTRRPEDIKVIARPPWWTPLRLLCVIVALLALLAVILVWNASLRVIAERRGRRLFLEKAERLKADLKVEERTRLAVELHDALSQTLTGIALLVDSAEHASDGDGKMVGRLLSTVRQMLASCRRELQGCLWDLRSRTFEEKDMTEAVMRTICPNVGDAKVTCRFNVPRDALSETTTHAILRIVRELVVNAVGHGAATNVRIAGEYRDGMVKFSVADNGVGFDPATAAGPAQGHFGLQGIRERINDFNGSFAVDSAPGRGTKATMTIKLKT